MTFGEKFKVIRKRNGSLRTVAELLGTDFAYLSKLENDRLSLNPSREFINKIFDKLDCTIEEKNDLLTEAGRIEETVEESAKEANSRQELMSLFKSAPKLNDEDLEELNKRVRQMLEDNNND